MVIGTSLCPIHLTVFGAFFLSGHSSTVSIICGRWQGVRRIPICPLSPYPFLCYITYNNTSHTHTHTHTHTYIHTHAHTHTYIAVVADVVVVTRYPSPIGVHDRDQTLTSPHHVYPLFWKRRGLSTTLQCVTSFVCTMSCNM